MLKKQLVLSIVISSLVVRASLKLKVTSSVRAEALQHFVSLVLSISLSNYLILNFKIKVHAASQDSFMWQ